MSEHARICRIGPVACGPRQLPVVIAGLCVLESRELGFQVAELLRNACDEARLPLIFKGSFDKANRSSIRSARGPGIELGLKWLSEIRESLDLPVTTDIHEPSHALPVAEVVDCLQVPAFLCRQTDLLLAAGEAAARHGRAVNVKKGQFMAPREMLGVVRKLAEAGCGNVLLTERGTFFGYHRLVNDLIGIGDLMELPAPGGAPPVCWDITHSTQLPGASDTTGGRPDRAPLLARAAAAIGTHAIFLECHPDPPRAMSDASTALPLSEVPHLLAQIAAIHRAASEMPEPA